MDSLRRMEIFSRVVEAGSFAAAARRLGIARSAVSRHITLLEKSIGARLLNRTTRRLSLTEAGQTYYRSCARIVAEAEAATRRIRQLRDEPGGTLKVAGPTSFAPQLAALASAFMREHAGMNIELVLSDQVVNMVEEGIDVSIRIGWLQDSSLIARKLCDAPRLLCASPDYLERQGMPQTPAQLAEHECIVFTLLPTPYQWTFSRNRRRFDVTIRGRAKTNSAIAARSLAREGAGIAVLSEFLIRDDLHNGRLLPVLAEYDCGSAGIYAVYQEREYPPARLRLFIDFLLARMAQ